MADLATFFQCLISPSLFYSLTTQWEKYQPNNLESLGISVISTINIIKALGTYASPLVVWILYRRGYASTDGMMTLGKITLSIGIIMGTSYCIRSYGRATNPKYRDFLKKLDALKKAQDGNGNLASALKEIKRFDFDFSAWPVQYSYNKNITTTGTTLPVSLRSLVASLVSSPCSVIGFFVMHTFGIRLLYPGSMSILNYLLRQPLMDGRISLIEKMGGERFKLKTVDSNYIDTMFVDKRKSPSSKGMYLVICSEGNAGFYETGIMPAAIQAGFSVLGWNHPGFGASTGMPYLEQEHNAVETVMQFAVHDLHFAPDHMILFGWSIGGYSTAYAASRYPSAKQVIVDATFDDVLPLAQNQMPDILDSIVKTTIRCYADLNVAELLQEYQGPIKMVRRTQDEVIAIEPYNVATNRGNFLLHKILKRRYPSLFNRESEGAFLNWTAAAGSAKANFVASLNIKAAEYEAQIKNYTTLHGAKFPLGSFGKDLSEEEAARVLIHLAETYMVDYDSTHCTPLPATIFQSLVVTKSSPPIVPFS